MALDQSSSVVRFVLSVCRIGLSVSFFLFDMREI